MMCQNKINEDLDVSLMTVSTSIAFNVNTKNWIYIDNNTIYIYTKALLSIVTKIDKGSTKRS